MSGPGTAGVEGTERGHAVLPLRIVDGEDAARRIEEALLALKGVEEASVNLPAQRARVEFDPEQTSLAEIRWELREMGYVSAPPAAHAHGPGCCRPREPVPEEAGWLVRHRELALSLTAGAFLVLAWTAGRWLGVPRTGVLALYALSYGFGGYDLVRHWVAALRQGKISFDIDLLMLLAAGGAAALGQWAEGAFLLFLFSLAHALEHYALGRARTAIRELADLAPAVARVRRGDRELELSVEEVMPGDLVIVLPGERIPVDGEVLRGSSAVNQAPITGESVPREKSPGDEVFAGSVNGEGALDVETTRAAGDRTLDRVVQLVEEAQTQKAPTQQFTDRFAKRFVPLALAAVVVMMTVPPLLGVLEWSEAFYRAMALLVASSPCALALGTPSAVLAGIAQAARNGLLVKGGAHLENLASARVLALDKTGTVTVGTASVTDVQPIEATDEDELLRVAAAVERRSQHPLAKAVVRRAEHRGLPLGGAGELRSVTGRGVRAELEGEMVEIGNLRLWADQDVEVPSTVRERVTRLQESGRSTMVVRHGTRWLGVLGLADEPRAGLRPVFERLRALGIERIVMLTGDNRGVADAVGGALGVDEVHAELLPQHKYALVRELERRHGAVVMVGDGINDAPALAQATVGIAMGGAGTAVALETADVALMGDDLARLPFAVGLSHRAGAIIRQNLYIALGVIAGLVVATTTGAFGIGAAVIAHEGSTLVVIANALRLLRYRGEG